jgi:tetratricopeptide (TPR) repeat protein
MWVELCPNDLDAHNVLATQYEDRNQLDDAVLEYKRILEFAPWQHTILWSIGNVYTEKGEFEQALKYYKRYADKCPDDSRSFRKIGALYETFGDYKQAKQYYDKALLIEPEYVNALVSLADIDAKLGNFGKAFQQYQDALRISKSIVYDHLRRFYELRGKIGKALEYSRLALAEKEKLYPRMWWLQLRYKRQFLDLYLKTGKKDATVRIIQDMETQMAPYNKIEIADARLAMYLELDDIENAERTVEDVEKTIQKYKYEAWRDIALHAWGRIHEMKGEYKQAMENYQKELELKPTDWGINTDIGRCYKNVKDYKKAEKHIKKTLEILPFDPKAHYEIALVYADMDKKEKAVEHLKKALYVWEDADPDYQPAKKAREKLKELEATL